jgi:rod shape-determining protein MreB
MISGIPKTIKIDSEEVRGAIAEPISVIIDTIKDALEQCPPELAADIVDRGMVLTGGGALLRNLDILLQEETRLPVRVANEPMSAVAMGAGMALDEINLLKGVSMQI